MNINKKIKKEPDHFFCYRVLQYIKRQFFYKNLKLILISKLRIS